MVRVQFIPAQLQQIARCQHDFKPANVFSRRAILKRPCARSISSDRAPQEATALRWIRRIQQSLRFYRPLKVRQNNSGLGDGMTVTLVVMNDAFDPVEFVSGEDYAAESNATSDGSSAGTGDCYRCSFPRRRCENLPHLVNAFRQQDAFAITVAHVAGVGQERLDFVWVGFDLHTINLVVTRAHAEL